MNLKRLRQQPPVFDVSTLENEIGDLVHRERPHVADYEQYAPAAIEPPPAPRPPVELGEVTAQAVVAQFAALSKTFTDWKEPLEQLANQHQTALADLVAEIKYIDETIVRISAVGQANADRLKQTSVTISEVRKLCDDARSRLDPA
jgi:hypothetical protein